MSEDEEDGDTEMEHESYGSEDDDEEDDDEDDGYDTSSTDEDSDDEPLLNHARQLYSEKSFDIFKHEYKKGLALSFASITDKGDFVEYKVNLAQFNTYHRVLAFSDEQVATCSCNYFSITGILCCHALVVLQCLHIKHIPEHYLLKWRMKSEKIDLATKLNVIKEKNHKQRRLSSDDNFPNKSINRSVHEKKFEELYSSRIEDGEEKVYSDYVHVGAPLLRHAKEIYVSNIADMFRKEYINSQYLFAKCLVEVIKDGRMIFECTVYKRGHCFKSKIVRAIPVDGTINCSCNKFERDGILCSHALAVLDGLAIVRIPPQYLREDFLKSVPAQVKDIHGPQYSDHALFSCYSVIQLRRYLSSEACAMLSRSLASASSKPVDVKKDYCEAKRQKEKVRFSDDQALNNFVYKELKLQGE